MTRPNEEFMRRYGTDVDFQEKEAGISPLAKRMLFAMAASRMATSWDTSMNQQRQLAMMMNDRFQQLQMDKMGPSIQNIHHTSPTVFVPPEGDIGYAPYPVPIGMDMGMVRVASAIGAELAQMDKDAGIMSGLAGWVSKSKPLAKPLFQVGNALKAPFGKAITTAAPSVAGGVAGAARNAVRGVNQVGKVVAPKVQALGRGLATAGAIGLGAAGLGAYAATKPALGYLSKEQQPTNWGMTDYGATQLPYGTNQYGYPQLGTPFMR